MIKEESYKKAVNLLSRARTDKGFLASASDITNYKRVWARDGVICGLAALLDGDLSLTETFKNTLTTLAENQHELGHIPSNVFFNEKDKVEISFGGLAGRVDTISWFIIGVCNYAHLTKNLSFAEKLKAKMDKGLKLLQAWEFNNNHLIYVPRSGNWADEYITEGHIFYDQVLRLWALKCINTLFPSEDYKSKINIVEEKLVGNYNKTEYQNPFHPKAYKTLEKSSYWMASINPSGYQTMFDALGNSIALLINLGSNEFQEKLINYSENLRGSLRLKLLPAFWEPITENHEDWKLLENNCKYEFRNIPYEFHNGGTWQMVNGFYGMSLVKNHTEKAKDVLRQIKKINSVEKFKFYENFNSKTGNPTGVEYCTWSAAGEVALQQYISGKRLLA